MEALADTDKQTQHMEVWQMFDRIVRRYDLLNHILSFGQDIRWRKKVALFLTEKSDQYILDLATGTGDQLISIIKNTHRISKAIGTDLAIEMLNFAREKVQKKQLEDRIVLEEGDAEQIQYEDNTFDAVTIAFGIRNVQNIRKTISEMYRVLKPEGRVLILEFSLPKNRVLRRIYLFYFRNILPRIGTIISSDGYAYRYLNETVENFPYGDEFCKILVAEGFEKVSMRPLTFGIATIYFGDKIDLG
jgi:demethylmenaquinone methyltransferase/2-methoxy-6-polyprenyl-1,4-benzoquinol methylase